MKELFDYVRLIFGDADTSDTNADNSNTDTEGKGDKSNNADDNSGGNEKKYTDADIDKIIERKFAKWQKQKAAEIDEAKKLAEMNATERAEHERDALKAELDALKAANTRAELEKTARSILQGDGVNVSDDLVSHLVADDADTTSANVKAFVKAFKAAVQDEIKSQLAHKAPASGGSNGITKEMISKEENVAKRQQMIRENISLYKRR